jgi:hypothetical protein
MRTPRIHTAAAFTILGVAAMAAAETTVVDFESGAEGWVGPSGPGGFTVVAPDSGNPGAHMHTVFNDFGITFRNSSNPAFAQDFSQYDSVSISMDLKVEDISFFGTPASRPWFVEIRDYDNVPAGYPWVSVWYHFEWVGAGDWTTWSVTIDDPGAVELPVGWGGYGDEDPDTFEPILPANRTFTDVLAGADEMVFSTLEPGWFFGSADFDVRLDNITIGTTGGQEPIPGDANGDGLVDVDDLTAVILAWGPCTGPCPADFDGNQVVDVDDLTAVILNWS